MPPKHTFVLQQNLIRPLAARYSPVLGRFFSSCFYNNNIHATGARDSRALILSLVESVRVACASRIPIYIDVASSPLSAVAAYV